MPTRLSVSVGLAVALVATGPVAAAPIAAPDVAGPPQAYVAVEQVIEASDLGLVSATGVTFVPETGELLVSGSGRGSIPTLVAVTPTNDLRRTDVVPSAVADGAAYDPVNEILVSTPDDDQVVTLAAPGGDPGGEGVGGALALGDGTISAPSGVAISPEGHTLVLGGDNSVVILADVGAAESATVVGDLRLIGVGEPLSGLAVASDRSLFSFGATSGDLYEFSADGSLVAARDLAGAGPGEPRGMVLAPSADTTDAPDDMSLYVADAGSAAGGGAVFELALAAPKTNDAAITLAVDSVTLVNAFDTGAGSAWNPDSPDPSGMAYIPTSETEVPVARRDRLVVGDGEVEETTGAGFQDVNIWFAPRSGSVQTATFDTTVPPTNPNNTEPVGLAYDAVRNELYVCNDGAQVWVYDAVSMSQDRTFSAAAAPYSNQDCEGLGFGGGVLYMVDAIDNDLVKVQPGPNGVVGNGADDVVTDYDLQQYGQSEPEGLDVHPVTGNLWIVSNRLSGSTPDPMLEVTPTGDLVSSVSIAAADPIAAAGVAIAPPSAGGSGFNIYVADRGVDNSEDSDENDGEVYEFIQGEVPEPTTTITSGPQGTVASTSATFTFSGSNATSFECQLDNSAYATCTSPRTYSGLTEGSHMFRVRSVGPGGTDATPASRSWTVNAGGASGNPFTDIIGHPFEHDIDWLYQEGLTSGCTATTFCPDSTVLRDQMASFLDRALPLPATSIDFFDDDDGNIHEAAINRLAASGITGGCDVREYCPKDSVRRDQMASFLSRAFELGATATDFFTDDAGNLHEVQINRLAASGITGGCAPGRYCPTQLVSRGQMAAFLHRAILD